MLLALPLLAACGSKPGNAPGAAGDRGSASCVAPYLNDEPPTGPYKSPPLSVKPGATITLYGHAYTSTCNDTGFHSPLQPLPPVKLTLTLPGGKVEQLGQLQAGGRDMGFSVRVRIPDETPHGTAKITDNWGPFPATYRFTVMPA